MKDDAVLEDLRRDLAAALTREQPGTTLGHLEIVDGGRSAVTAFADLDERGGGTRRVAVRALPRDAPDLAVGSLSDQFALLELLGDEPVLAPRPLLLDDSKGATYDLLVTAYVEGRVPQPWRRAGREEIAGLRASREFRDDFVRTLARIHQVSATRLPPGLGHEGAGSAAAHSVRALGRCSRSFAASEVFADDPVLAYCLVWLEQHAPTTTHAPGLVHGDYRMGNLVVDPHGRLCGVLDWELAEAGETLSDVAWLCGPQGLVDGWAGGLFEPEELVADYERATGSHVDVALFEHLRLEGTMRTAAVWAQLGVAELERGRPAVALRCQESVLQLIGLCAASLGLHHVADSPPPPAPPASSGIATLAGRLGRALTVEGHESGPALPPALRASASFLDRLSGLLADGEQTAYAAACAELTGAPLPPGAALAGYIRQRQDAGVRLDDGGPDATELRRLVAWSATASIAFANLLDATGTAGTRP